MSAPQQPGPEFSPDLHLGWHQGKVCVGAGPVRMRYTLEEADALLNQLADLLDNHDKGHDTACDCNGQVTAEHEDADTGDQHVTGTEVTRSFRADFYT